MPFVRIPGPTVPHWPIPGLVDIPVIGRILFNHNAMVYLSYVVVVATWWFLAHSRPGLQLRAVGERPEAAYARGNDANRLRYVYTAVGGAFVGLAGAAYSLSVKIGWSHGHTSGMGWIALAIVIFGGWSPLRVALGAYLFGALKSLGSILQPTMPHVPTQVFQAAPFALMIVALVLVSWEGTEGAARRACRRCSPARSARDHRPAAGHSAGRTRQDVPAGLRRRHSRVTGCRLQVTGSSDALAGACNLAPAACNRPDAAHPRGQGSGSGKERQQDGQRHRAEQRRAKDHARDIVGV